MAELELQWNKSGCSDRYAVFDRHVGAFDMIRDTIKAIPKHNECDDHSAHVKCILGGNSHHCERPEGVISPSRWA